MVKKIIPQLLALVLVLVTGFFLGKYRIHLYNWVAVRTGLETIGEPTPSAPTESEPTPDRIAINRVTEIIAAQELGSSAEVASFARSFVAGNVIHKLDEEEAKENLRILRQIVAELEEKEP